MSGQQHSFPSNYGAAGQNDLRSQFGGPQRGQLPGISSPGQPSGMVSPQTYNVGVGMQPPADSPIQAQQMQQPGQPTPQQLQLHMQQLQQQQASQQVENTQQTQQSSAGPQQLPQPGIPSQQSPVSQPTGLHTLQQVAAPGGQNINVRLTSGDGSIQSVTQSTVGPSGAISSAGVSSSAPQQPPSNQQYNTASLCTFGQETVQDIVSKLHEAFQILKSVSPQSGLLGAGNVSNERKQKLSECLKLIRTLFKRLRLIYERVNDSSQLQGTEYMHIESLIPLEEECNVKTSEERKTSESYRLASEECKELAAQVILKNNQIKEVIDRLRRIIWEVNTMLTMRKS